MAMLRRQKDTDAARRKKTGRPIFRTIFNAMMLVTLVEVVLLAVSIAITNVDGRLNQNAKDMLNMQVRNRVSYVQDLMQDAQNLTDLSEHINNTVLAMQEEGQLDLAELNTSREKSDALLTAIAPELVMARQRFARADLNKRVDALILQGMQRVDPAHGMAHLVGQDIRCRSRVRRIGRRRHVCHDRNQQRRRRVAGLDIRRQPLSRLCHIGAMECTRHRDFHSAAASLFY